MDRMWIKMAVFFFTNNKIRRMSLEDSFSLYYLKKKKVTINRVFCIPSSSSPEFFSNWRRIKLYYQSLQERIPVPQAPSEEQGQTSALD